MITLTKNGNAVKFLFEDSQHYLMGDGEIQVPVNSLSLIIDESEMVTFKKASSDDIFVSFDPADSNLSTKDGVIQFYKENMVGSTGGGSGSGVTSGQVESMISEALEDYPTNDDVDETLEDYYTKDEVDAGFSSVTSSVTAVNASLTAHTADTTIHVTSADKTAWNNKSNFSGDYNDLTNKPTIPVVPTSNTAFTNDAGYITEADIADKADTSAITGFFGAVAYNSNDKKIYFYHENTGETALAYVDATDFIKDGMVDNVEIKTLSGASYLAITFNSDAGKEEIDIPIADIFDANNYYNKTETDTLLAAKLDATAYTPTDLSQYWTSAQTSAAINEATSGKANASDVTAALANKQDVSGMTAYVSHAEFDPKEETISSALNDLNDRVEDKQDALEAGTGIDITNNVISVTASTGGSNVIELTQAQYEALVDKDPDVIYVITDAPEINISGKADTSAVTVVSDALTAHTADTSIHTTAQEKSTWNGKQDALVSGTNIKTINNQSLLGSGNIDIQGGGGGGISSAQCQTMIEDYCDPKEEVVATALNDLNGRVEHLETGGTGVTIATAITSSSTNSEAAGALATYNAITAATTGGGATYSAGTNISIDTANTINCTLNARNGTGSYSFIIGDSECEANSPYSIAIGHNADAKGASNFVDGFNCNALGQYNFLFGNNLSVSNNNSQYNLLVGNQIKPSTNIQYCAAIGHGLKLENSYELAIGYYNNSVTGSTSANKNMFSIGNGYSYQSTNLPHNAFEIRQNGDVYFPDTDNTTYQSDYEKPMVRLQDMYGALGGLKFVKLTQSEYDQLATKDANTLYIITNVVS